MDPPPSPTIERPVLARVNSTPTSSQFGDPESQQDSRWQRLKRPRRTSTFSTQDTTIAEESSRTERRNTGVSVDSGLELKPTNTWIVKEVKHGYPRLASFLGGTQGYSIYRRFSALNARNLLYHQAKLTQLEDELLEMEGSMGDEQGVHYKVQHVSHAERDSPEHRLHKKYEEISRALDVYNKLLLDQQRLHKLPAPDHSLVDAIYRFIGHSARGTTPDWPSDSIYGVWEDNRKPIQEDLITLNPECRAQDLFTKFFTGKIVSWWHPIYSRFKPPNDKLSDMDGYLYTETATTRYIRAIVMIVASALPASSIIALYYIPTPIWRLIFIALFSVVFAAALTFFTGASRTEIFVGSATLASVQVVFVGTAFGNGHQHNT